MTQVEVTAILKGLLRPQIAYRERSFAFIATKKQLVSWYSHIKTKITSCYFVSRDSWENILRFKMSKENTLRGPKLFLYTTAE